MNSNQCTFLENGQLTRGLLLFWGKTGFFVLVFNKTRLAAEDNCEAIIYCDFSKVFVWYYMELTRHTLERLNLLH